jgi:hypothetical protein
MTLRDKLTRRLNVQAEHEGEDAVKDCRTVLAHCASENEWRALTTVRWHRYGPMSYEAHAFYDLKPFVRVIAEALTEETCEHCRAKKYLVCLGCH